MRTIGWLFIITAAMTVRAAVKGQLFDASGQLQIGDYLRNLATAITTGNYDDASALTNSPGGTSILAPTAAPEAAVTSPLATDEATTAVGDSDLLAAMTRRGRAARGYRWSATGPDWYDCSGLMWRAVQDVRPDLRRLPRFTTYTMLVTPWGKHFDRVASPMVGDVVLWRTHVGVVSGKDKFYSARNPSSGIGESSISGFNTGHGNSHAYYRLKKAG